ncbi:hypothetical protein GH119_11590 [Staphylococcus pseudintermedius]|nr:hypothetical protein [Staphylococcus pseudintermedius]
MNLPKLLFNLVYIMTPLTYIIVYSVFTLIRGNDVFTAIHQMLPMIAIYYFIASIVIAILFEKIVKKIKKVKAEEQ